VKKHSWTLIGQTVTIPTLKQFQNIPFGTVSGCVTAVYDNHRWLGYIMEKSEETGKIYI
jgi:hypothetical protein